MSNKTFSFDTEERDPRSCALENHFHHEHVCEQKSILDSFFLKLEKLIFLKLERDFHRLKRLKANLKSSKWFGSVKLNK